MSSHYYRFRLKGEVPERSPLLERLAARADASLIVGDWRADAFRRLAAGGQIMPAVAAAAFRAERLAAGDASVYLATPVHYTAGMSDVRLAADGILALRSDEAQALADDFNRIWHDAGVRLLAGRSAGLYCLFEESLEALTEDPQRLLGESIDKFLPSGRDAARLRRLASEMEMWLFEHAVNRARGPQAAITGFWLWGGGAPLDLLPSVTGWTVGHDVFFQSLGADAAPSAARSGVAVIDAQPGSRAWAEAERQWLAPSVAALRSGRLERLELSAGNRCVTVTGAGRWRWWRRRRPWWEQFA